MFPISSLAAQLFAQNPDFAISKTEADGPKTGSSSTPQPSALNDRDSSRLKSDSQNAAQCPSAHKHSTVGAAEDESSSRHEADLEEMSALMDQIQKEAASLLHTSTAWPSSTDTQTSVATHKQPQPVSISPSYHTHSENRIGQEVVDIEASNAHTVCVPKPEVNRPVLDKTSSPKGHRYGNTLPEDKGAMAVGRGHTQETAGDNEVFKKQPASPTPAPRKRYRLPTDPPPGPKSSPKLAPKPKPAARRKTTPAKSESDEPTSRIEDILASSAMKGKVRISPGTSRRLLPSHEHNGTAQMHRNLEVREDTAKSKTLPPSSTRTHSSHSASSPGTAKKPTPPVAPKPSHKKK